MTRLSPDNFSRRALLGSCLGSVFVPLLGCSSRRKGADNTEEESLPEYRGPLVDPASIQANFVWEQRVTAIHGENQGAFDAVLQKEGSELLVLGLTPFRTRGFSLTQRGTSHEYQQFVPFQLPFDPKAVLIDIHRAFFFSMPNPFPMTATRTTPYEHETVIDRFEKGALAMRTYENLMGLGKDLVITYAKPGYRLYQPSRRTVLDNRAFGYRLEVETTSVTILD